MPHDAGSVPNKLLHHEPREAVAVLTIKAAGKRVRIDAVLQTTPT